MFEREQKRERNLIQSAKERQQKDRQRANQERHGDSGRDPTAESNEMEVFFLVFYFHLLTHVTLFSPVLTVSPHRSPSPRSSSRPFAPRAVVVQVWNHPALFFFFHLRFPFPLFFLFFSFAVV